VFLYLKSSLKNIFELRLIFYFGLSLDFWAVSWVFEVMNGFLWFLGCFINILGKKGLQNRFLGQREHKPRFSSHYDGRNLGKIGCTLSTSAGDASYVSANDASSVADIL
jgi:hypothetical protein